MSPVDVIQNPYVLNMITKLPVHKTKLYRTRLLSSIDHIAIHHTGSFTQSVVDVAKWHVNNRDWAGIGYHFFIDNVGVISQCNHLSRISNGIADFNTPCIHIAVLGNFERRNPNTEQKKSLHMIVALLSEMFPNLTVINHCDKVKTLCPGLGLKGEKNTLNLKYFNHS